MKVRDRLIIAAIAAVVAVGAVYLLLVSPERNQASSLSAQIVVEQATLASAETSLEQARTAAAGYLGDVHALAQVTTAIPTSADEPSVITTITKLAGTKVNVHSVSVGGSGATTAGPNSLGLTFSFHASYTTLQSFLTALDQLTRTDGTNVAAAGRLFTVSGVSFTPDQKSGTSASVTASSFSQVPTAVGATTATGVTPTAAVTP